VLDFILHHGLKYWTRYALENLDVPKSHMDDEAHTSQGVRQDLLHHTT
jgi:hypothetical protein